MDEPTQTESSPPRVRPRVRAAISRAVARRQAPEPISPPDAAGPPPEPAAPADPAVQAAGTPWVAPPLPRRQERWRSAAARAAERERVGAAPRRSADPVSALSLGRTRTRARPRMQERVAAGIAWAAPASAEPLIAPEPAAQAIPAPPPASGSPAAQAAGPPWVAAELPALLQPDAPPIPDLRRPPILLAVVAGCCWAGMLGWLLLGRLGPATAAPTRLLFGAALVAVGLLTWAPLQWATRLPVLTWRGTVGWGTLLWTLAFVPPATERLVAGLPDLPVYALFFGGIYLASNAVALPLVYIWGRRRHQSGRQIYDPQRARRQAAECSIFITMCAILRAMNILELGTVILLIAILGLSEWVVLSLRR
ncbi:MAG TPA: hypothetical protein VD886_18100 [Herpetosiphonaceae bacterium]|nr:hypothetical protein [Herpetosiphonaceae bacterium]